MKMTVVHFLEIACHWEDAVVDAGFQKGESRKGSEREAQAEILAPSTACN